MELKIPLVVRLAGKNSTECVSTSKPRTFFDTLYKTVDILQLWTSTVPSQVHEVVKCMKNPSSACPAICSHILGDKKALGQIENFQTHFHRLAIHFWIVYQIATVTLPVKYKLCNMVVACKVIVEVISKHTVRFYIGGDQQTYGAVWNNSDWFCRAGRFAHSLWNWQGKCAIHKVLWEPIPDPGNNLRILLDEYCKWCLSIWYSYLSFHFSHCLIGFNVDEAKKILKESGLPIQTADDMDTAAQKAVASLQ